MVNGELPRRENKRGGPGWWMDLDGVWRPPSEWPHDHAPLDGWQRAADGGWQPPSAAAPADPDRPAIAVLEATELAEPSTDPVPAGRSRQANADRRAMFLVAGALGTAALLLAAALILITQAGADDVVETEVKPEVIYAAETNAVRMQRRAAVAALAPDAARAQLLELVTRADDAEVSAVSFAERDWVATNDDCLDVAEDVLVARSTQPVGWADELECVPDSGRWVDRNLQTVITRTLDADVVPHVPPAIAYASGGSEWTAATRQAYLTDTRHPATLQIVAKGSGHNPRVQDPSAWKPSNPAVWCAYAVDWVAVKHRWELSVTKSELLALTEMLDSCSDANSVGADPLTMVIDPIAPPSIERFATG